MEAIYLSKEEAKKLQEGMRIAKTHSHLDYDETFNAILVKVNEIVDTEKDE